MATSLTKDVIRESTVTIKDRTVIVTLTKDQKINLKLKGLKSGNVSISIDELYEDLVGSDDKVPREGTNKNPMISLHDLRTSFAILDKPYEVKAYWDKHFLKLMLTEKNS